MDVREGYRCKLATLKPMNGCRVDCNSLLSADIWTVLEITVLSLLFCLKIQASQATEVLLNDCLVDSCTAANSFAVVVSNSAKYLRDMENVGSTLTMSTNPLCS